MSSQFQERPRDRGLEDRTVEHVRALDGVRALGVALVFLFHLNVAGFAAGFIGVDVFFVLSGFLITSLLLQELRGNGRASVPRFWARRARRLLPALVVLLLVVALVTMKTATFSERTLMRSDLISTMLYVANWHFIATSGYFNSTGVVSPLAHTWSLGIEEQFYLLWPIVIVVLGLVFAKTRRALGVTALIGSIVSAGLLAALFMPGAVDRAYMGTDARIFEPLLGAWAAVIVAGPAGRRLVERRGTWLALFGALGLTVMLFVIRPGGAFYYRGGAELVSVSTALIVASLWVGRGGPLRRVLGWTPVAWIGLISYGLYVWHWPFVVWLHIDEAYGVNGEIRKLLAVVATLVVATASFYLIERPIRTGNGWRLPWRARHVGLGFLRRPLIVLGLVPLVMVSVIGVSVASTEVPPIRPGTPVIMLVGDSVPEHLEPDFEALAQPRSWRVISAARGACAVTGERSVTPAPPPLDVALHDARDCPTVPPEQDALVNAYHPSIVVWWDRWSLAPFVGPDGQTVVSGSALFWKLRTERMDAAVKRLAADGGRVLFVATEPPGIGAARHCPLWCTPWRHFITSHYGDIARRWNSILAKYAHDHPQVASFMSVTDVICHADVSPCDDRVDGRIGRPDGFHYRGMAAQIVVKAITHKIAQLIATRD